MDESGERSLISLLLRSSEARLGNEFKTERSSTELLRRFIVVTSMREARREISPVLSALISDALRFEERITSKTRVILIGYPANPTGAVMSREKLLEVAEVARRHQLLVVSDEIYARLVYGVEHTCFAGLPGMQENTILLGGFSKAYAMTG